MRMTKETVVRTATADIDGRIQKRANWARNMTAKVQRRVMRSEIQAQKMRPTALPMETMPTMPAATTALTMAIFWNMGDSWEMTEMPAEVLRKRSSQRAHHCQDLRASPMV